MDNRNKAILKLAKFQDDQAIAAIQKALNRNPTRIAAAVALSALHREEGRPVLTQVVKTGSQPKRLDLIEFIGMAPSEFGAQLLLGLLEDNNLNIKVAAITALGKTRTLAAAPQLQKLLTDTNLRIRQAAFTSLSQLDKPATINAILVQAKQPGHELSAQMFKILGDLHAREALPLLSEQLAQREQAYRKWRNIRDEVRDDFTEDQLDDWKKRLEANPPKSYLNFQLGYTLARIDPEGWGVKLLAHDLAKVREGAWMGLGKEGTVTLLQRIYRDWLKTDDPLFRHAAYRAMDHILMHLESFGTAEDIQQLKQFYTGIQKEMQAIAEQNQQSNPKPYDPRDSVATRVEWTISQWEFLVQPQLQAKKEN